MPTIHRTSQSIQLPHETVRLPLIFFHVLFVFQACAIIHNMLHEDSGYNQLGSSPKHWRVADTGLDAARAASCPVPDRGYTDELAQDRGT